MIERKEKMEGIDTIDERDLEKIRLYFSEEQLNKLMNKFEFWCRQDNIEIKTDKFMGRYRDLETNLFFMGFVYSRHIQVRPRSLKNMLPGYAYFQQQCQCEAQGEESEAGR